VYVAEATGEIVMKTDRSSRLWGYAGPVMHWFYFTPLRAGRAPLWNNLIVYGSVVGCVLCVLGIVIGLYRFSAARRYKHGASRTPYVGWLRWHHYAGLLFGVMTLTWTFSGLLTMTPWNMFDQGGPTPAQARAIRGNGVDLSRFQATPQAALAALHPDVQPKELELLQLMGVPYYAASAAAVSVPSPVLVTAEATPRVRGAFAREELETAARAVMPGVEPAEVAWLTGFDAYYYDRTGTRPLPVLRAKYDDPEGTWLYLDAATGSLVQTEVRESRAERWLYQGLHSLDLPGLYQVSWVWYPLIVGWRFLTSRV